MLSVYETLALMIAFATLILLIDRKDSKKSNYPATNRVITKN